ncbi:MAG: hypothetical protein COB46_12690 [Rhodospirillaceae bacterium]|nr:MAG: hypothetical protein COB46_12690 [Rhodospirillaceae bacterium]
MLRYFCLLSLTLFGFISGPAVAPAVAMDLDVDLSKPDVRLNVSFKGAELLLFGAKDAAGDVIVVVRGPQQNKSVRLREKIAGVWVSTDEVIFGNAPAYYALASSRPIYEILPAAVMKSERIGTDHLDLQIKAKPDGATQQTIQDFTDGLVRIMIRKDLYTNEAGVIELVGKKLFRTDLWFPANVSVGEYTVNTYLIANGVVETKKTSHIQVHKVGIEARVYNFAHEQALIYGILAVIIAVISGWTANAIFKKRA